MAGCRLAILGVFLIINQLQGQSPAIEVVLDTKVEIENSNGLRFQPKTPSSTGPPDASYVSMQVSGRGHVAGKMNVSGPGVNITNDLVVFYVRPGEKPVIVLRKGDPARGLPAGMVWGAFHKMQLDSHGALYIQGYAQIPGQSGLTSFILGGIPPNLEPLAYAGMTVGEAGATLSMITDFAVNKHGELAVVGIVQAGIGVSYKAIWKGIPSPQNELVRTGRQYPFLPDNRAFVDDVFSDSFIYLSLNTAGEMLFWADLRDQSGIWLISGGEPRRLALEREAVPGMEGVDYGPIGPFPILGENGRFSFYGNTSANSVVLMGGHNQTASPLLREGDPVPGADEGMTFPAPLQFSDTHQLLIRGSVIGGSGLWVLDGVSLSPVALPGGVPPGIPTGSYRNIRDGIISPVGRIAFGAVGEPGINNPGIWAMSSDGEFHYAAGRNLKFTSPEGQVGTIQTAFIMRGSFDDRGRFPAFLRYSGAGSGYALVLIDPDLLVQTAAGISGFVLRDNDHNGMFSQADTGIKGVRIGLYANDGQAFGHPIRETTTGDGGGYHFSAVPSGRYLILVTVPAGLRTVANTSGTGTDPRITLAYVEGQVSSSHHFLMDTDADARIAIQMHQLNELGVANIKAGQLNVDAPLEVHTDPGILAQQPEVKQGLVADGVTPLLFSVRNDDPNYSGNRVVTPEIIEIRGGGITGGLVNRILVLRQGNWATVIQASELTIPPASTSSGWLQISPIGSDEIHFEEGSNELSAVLRLKDASNGHEVGRKAFKIRKPPVTLVHGYNTPGDWGDAYRNQLHLTRPFSLSGMDNFILTIRYGQQLVEGLGSVLGAWATFIPDQNRENTVGSFAYLAQLLQQELEVALKPLHDNWAFTRHDVVAHSQGGILARMLCSETPTPAQAKRWYPTVRPFQSRENFYRGRFHRVVTIGSPHNGSRLVRYIRELYQRFPWPLAVHAVWSAKLGFWSGTVRNKFDPEGVEIAWLRDPKPDARWKPDPDAKFHLVRSTINQGLPPSPQSSVYLERRLLLNSLIGPIVLPHGSDGVVDFESMGAQSPGENPATNVFSLPSFLEISHSGPEDWFSREPKHPDATGQTASLPVAMHIRKALDQTTDAATSPEDIRFGPFPLSRLSYSDLEPIAEAARNLSIFNLGNIQPPKAPLGPKLSRIAGPLSDRATSLTANTEPARYPLQLFASPEHPPAGEIEWYVERFGAQGVQSYLQALEPHPSDPTQATLVIPNNQPGDYVVSAFYTAVDGSLVFSAPCVAASIEPSGTEIREFLFFPNEARFDEGISITPLLVTTYADGTAMQRAPYQALFRADSSILDVSQPALWRTLGTGETTVTAVWNGRVALAHIRIQAAAQHGLLTYQEWAEAFFSPVELGNTTISGPRADAEEDHCENIFEYLFLGHPKQPESAPFLHPDLMLIDQQLMPVLSFETRQFLDGHVIVIERSSNLRDWEQLVRIDQDSPLESEYLIAQNTADDTMKFVVRDKAALNDQTNHFLRIRVESE